MWCNIRWTDIYRPRLVVSGAGITRPAPTSLGAAIALLVDDVAHFALHVDHDHAQTVSRLAHSAPDATAKREVLILLIEPTDVGFRWTVSSGSPRARPAAC